MRNEILREMKDFSLFKRRMERRKNLIKILHISFNLSIYRRLNYVGGSDFKNFFVMLYSKFQVLLK